MINRSVSGNTERYGLTPAGGGSEVEYDIAYKGTVDVAGTDINDLVLLSDTVAEDYGLDHTKSITDPANPSFASPNNAFAKIRTELDGLLDFFYPIGTIYQTDTITTAEAMSLHFGGTWAAWGAGRVPVGYSSGDPDFGTVNGTGGSKTAIQAHTHSTPNHTHTIDNTTDTMTSSGSGTSGSTTPSNTGSASTTHSHDVAGASGTAGVHTHTLGSHDHDVEYYTYTTPSGSTHSIRGLAPGGGTIDATVGATPSISTHDGHSHNSGSYEASEVVQSHTHTSAAHTHTTPAHTHTMNAHTHTVTSTGGGTSGSAGTTGSTNLPPYQVCYFWKRTA